MIVHRRTTGRFVLNPLRHEVLESVFFESIPHVNMKFSPRKSHFFDKTQSANTMHFDVESLESRCLLTTYIAGALDPRFGDGGLVQQGRFTLDEQAESPTYMASLDGGVTQVVTGNMVAQFASDGNIDTSFGVDGVSNLLLHGFSRISDAVAKPDGSLVVIGNLLGRAEFGVAHVLSDGTLNEDFGDEGIVKTNFFGLGATGGTFASGLTLDQSGNVLVSFLRYGDVQGSYLAKFDMQGHLETTFASGGMLSLGDVNVLNVSELADGSILTAYRSSGGQLTVMRHLANGSPDLSFGIDGIVNHDVEMAFAIPDIKEDVEGRVYVYTPTFEKLFVHRLNPDGSLDNKFGNDGTVELEILPFGDGEGPARLAVQEDGKIVIAGRDDNDQIAVIRLLENGRNDRRFGNRGVAAFDLAQTDDGSGRVVSLREDGTIMVAGTSRTAVGTNQNGNTVYQQDFVLMSLSGEGETQNAFSSDGVVLERFELARPTSESGQQIALQSDGKIIVGSQHFDANSDFLISRFLPNGQLDVSFGDAGFVAVDMGEHESLEDLIVTADDKIVAMGSYRNVNGSGVSQMLAVRLNADGTTDGSFGTDGAVIVGVTGINTYGVAADEFADGKILLAARSYASGSQMMVVKLKSDGDFDTSFSGDGIAFTGSGTSQGVHDALAQPDGKVAILGHTSFPTNHTVLRLNADGSTDFGFGSGGRASLNFTSGYDNPRGLALQSDGKLVTVGGAGNRYFGIGRLNANGTPDNTFGSFGKVITNFGVFSANAEGVTVQPDGKMIVMGHRDNGEGYIVARYSANGTLDSTFGSGGRAAIDFQSDNERAYSAVVAGDGIISVGFAGNNYTDIALAKVFTVSAELADAFDDVYATNEDSSVSGNVLTDDTGNGADASPVTLEVLAVEGQAMNVGQTIFVAGGELLVNADGTFSYDASTSSTLNRLGPGQSTDVVFTYSIDDGFGGLISAEVVIQVAGVNDAPLIHDSYIETSEDNAIPFLQFSSPVFDVDDGDSVRLVHLEITSGDGEVYEQEGIFYFDPSLAYDALNYGDEATVTFETTIEDNFGAQTMGMATVAVQGTNDKVRALMDGTTLVVEGTPERDVIKFVSKSGEIIVTANGEKLGPFVATQISTLGLDGDDVIRANARVLIPLVVDGGDGNDQIVGGGVNDILIGGAGNDRIDGGNGNDELHGNEGDDQLKGKNGDDFLWGGIGFDKLVGGGGNDQLFGEEGDDFLSGGSGDDLLDGGPGNDRISEGPGRDTVV